MNNMMLKVVGITNEVVFYQVKQKGIWVQYKKDIDNFVYMMFKLFPLLRKRLKPYGYTDNTQIANWLYNYGENNDHSETYVFHTKFGY